MNLNATFMAGVQGVTLMTDQVRFRFGFGFAKPLPTMITNVGLIRVLLLLLLHVCSNC